MKRADLQTNMRNECENILCYIRSWESINEHGCNDPFWADGCNMNLLRNHIIYAKMKIMEICEEKSIPYPYEYFLPTPPEVSDLYMADLNKFPERTERVLYGGRKAVTKRTAYDKSQLTFLKK